MSKLEISRREFAVALAVPALMGADAPLAEAATNGQPTAPIDIAEWSYFWVGQERAPLAKGTYVGGKQMYVEYWIPAVVKHPVPILMVHGEGEQGLEWMGTPDERPGWATLLLQQGYKVYVVDLPGHGRAPFHPDLHGAFPPTAPTLEEATKQSTQWVGNSDVDSPEINQYVGSLGGSYVPPRGPVAILGARSFQEPPNLDAEAEQQVWRERGAMVLDRIGPAIIMTHESPFGSLVAEARPGLVKGLVAIGSNGQPGVNLKNIPVATVTEGWLADHNIHGNGHMMMVERNNKEVLAVITDWIEKNVPKNVKVPAAKKAGNVPLKLADMGFFWVGTEHKKMKYGTILSGQAYVQYLIPQEVRYELPILLVHDGTGQMLEYMGAGDGLAGWAHYYAQAGYKVYLIDLPGQGRAPYHPDALGPIDAQPMYGTVTADFKRAARGPNRQWLGTGDEGDPQVDRFMASQNAAPKNNVFAQNLWATRGAEIVDKIGPVIIQVHGKSGPFGYLVANERPGLVKAIVNIEGNGSTSGEPYTWGLADVPLTYDPPVRDPSQLKSHDVFASDGVVNQLPGPRKLTNLLNVPIVYVTGEMSERIAGPGHVQFLKQAGCDAEHLALKDKGVRGNGHYMMIENNRKQVFEVIRTWIETKIPAKTA